MKTIVISFLALLLTVGAFAEKNTSKNITVIKGTVADKTTGEPLPGVSVVIEGTNIQTYTDFDGNFTFNGVQPGHYMVIAEYVSYQKINSQVNCGSNKTSTVNLLLSSVEEDK